MLYKSLSMLLIAVLFCVSLASPVSGQISQTNQQKKTEKVKAKIKKLGVGEKVKIKVKLYSDASYKGYVSQANEDDFVVVDTTGNSNTIKYADVKSIAGKNLSTGAKVAIGVGIGVGATLLTLYLIFLHITENN